MKANRILSRQAAEFGKDFPGAFKYAQNQCVMNAQQSAALDRALKGGLYVEGFITLLGCPAPLFHAWIELNGEIVDPTLWVDPEHGDKHVADTEYFPGIRLNSEQLEEYTFVDEQGMYFAAITLRDPQLANSPEFIQAREQATEAAEVGHIQYMRDKIQAGLLLAGEGDTGGDGEQ